ncbi:hypothetical protein HPT25_23470 [Bacillus sp. BRMEA1]|uniref:hypothetical protein n=1 Tax=Neobacillus endophyticus TaxID=2738405 RepID=UPI001564371A|nr:hypothetical protein [Neobacillus endophyticus]NRD80286.1 hypothetical protein [Neobacillus endophyticus]
MNTQKDPLQSIQEAIKPIVAPFGVKTTLLGWPDPKYFQVDGNLPLLAILPVSDTTKHLASRETVHASIPNPYVTLNGQDQLDGTDLLNNAPTATVYKETLRLFYLLQLSIFTKTPEDRSNIGWQIQQYFVNNPQLSFGIPGVETGVFKYKGQHDLPGETNFYQRALTFEVSARVLDSELAYLATSVQMNEQPF